jgi:hypothetical protein
VCLKNKTLYLFGDSTVRQWYLVIKDLTDCAQFTAKHKEEKWKGAAGCAKKSNNFTMHKLPHAYPLYSSMKWKYLPKNVTSISKRLEKISSSENSIILIHVFAHMKTMHPKNFRHRMNSIRSAVSKLLKRNNNLKIFIKMPHTFTHSHGAINDFFGSTFKKIIVETFHGLYDKIIPLDQKDATIAVSSENLHPDVFIVKAMVKQMFSYLCK